MLSEGRAGALEKQLPVLRRQSFHLGAHSPGLAKAS